MSRVLIKNAVILTGTGKTEKGNLVFEENRIINVFEDYQDYECVFDRVIDADGKYVTPGLIDTHIHGINGFGTEDADSESICGMSESLVKYGVTGFFPTLYPDKPDKMKKAIDAVIRASEKACGSRVLGVHLEGPFISKQKKGALPEKYICETDLKMLEEILPEKSKSDFKICMTVAPEKDGMDELVKFCRKKNIKLLCGHTNADYECMNKAFDMGINHITHFFNAMSPFNHREPGAVGAVLLRKDVSVELIADGVHVHKDLISFMTALKAPDKIVLVTDSLKPTGLKSGRLFANGVEVVLSGNGAFVSAEDRKTLNGSSLTLNSAVRNVFCWTGNESNAVRYASSNPASVYGLEKYGNLIPNAASDVVIFNKNFEAERVFIGGKEIG